MKTQEIIGSARKPKRLLLHLAYCSPGSFYANHYLRSVQSHRTVQAAQHPDFNHFSKSTEQPVKKKCKGCGKHQVLCNLKPCHRQRTSIQQQPLQSFQSFTYGSGQISNSCHTDTFLESLFHSFIRQISPATADFNPSSSTMDALLEAIILREQGQFHKSKMTLWNFFVQQHNKWTHKFSSGRNGINFSDIWCTVTRNVEQWKGCTFHETLTNHSMLKKCTPSA